MYTNNKSRFGFGGVLLVLVLLTHSSCRQDQGERLFELNYPNQSFEVNKVLNTIESHFFIIGPLPNTLNSVLKNSTATENDITRIEPFYASITSIDGFSFKFIEEISIRICNVSDPSRCDLEIFYLDQIPFSAGDRLELLPSLANVKDYLIGENQFTIEVVFLRLRDFSPAQMDLRLNFGFDVRK